MAIALSVVPLGSLILAMPLAGCSPPVFRIDVPRVARLHRVALAGLTFQVELRRDLRDRYIETSGEERDEVVQIAASLAHLARTRMRERLGVEVVERIGQNAVYRNAVANHSLHVSAASSGPRDKVAAPDVAEYSRVRGLSLEARRLVLHALEVDAVVSIRLDVELNESATSNLANLVGTRELRPQSTIDFMMLDGATEHPLWHDPQSRGQLLDFRLPWRGRVLTPKEYAEAIVAAVDTNLEKVLLRRT